MAIIGEIIGFICGCLVIRKAFNLYDRDKLAAASTALVIGAFLLLCSFTWFQGWAKSLIASNILSRLTAIGEQVNTVQATTTDMLNQFSNQVNTLQQTDVAMQNELANHQALINTNQSNLGIAQTNLSIQQKQLSDVEYWVSNLFDNVKIEEIYPTNTDKVLWVQTTTNGIGRFLIRLDNKPIPNSAHIYVKDMRNGYEVRQYGVITFSKNLINLNLNGFDTNSVIYSVDYVADTRDSNIYQHMPSKKSIVIYTNSYWIPDP
jgi:hypothetical protein